jgi:hypothetical protein
MFVTLNPPTPPDATERAHLFIEGARALRAHPDDIEKLEGLLNEVSILTELETAPSPTTDAAAKIAGRKLWQVLGKECFADESEAVNWALRLPLTEARRAISATEAEKTRAGRQRNEAQKAFWTFAGEVAVKIALHSRYTNDLGKMTDEVINMAVRIGGR